MPYVRIETRGDWLKPLARELFTAVDDVLVKVLRVPPGDALIRLVCHDPALIRLPSGADPQLVAMEVALFPGRRPGTKAALYQEMAAAVAPLGIGAEGLTIALVEIGLDDWGIAGRPARDLSLPFPLDPESRP